MIKAETDAFPVAEACVEGVANGGEFTTVGAQTETVLSSGNIEGDAKVEFLSGKGEWINSKSRVVVTTALEA